MGTLLLAFCLIKLMDSGVLKPLASWTKIAIILCFLLECLSLVVNLWPHDITRAGTKIPNDGKNLLWCLSAKPGDVLQIYCAQLAGYAGILMREGSFDIARRVANEALRGVESTHGTVASTLWIYILLGHGRHQEALKECEELIVDSSATRQRRGAILDALASIPVFTECPIMIPMAVRCIDEAIQLEPETITFKGTKASLLIEEGLIAEGLEMMDHTERETRAETDLAICSYYRAYAHLKKGETAAAVERLLVAKRKYPQCPVAARIEAKIWGLR